jgi:hypothetical protein
VANPGRERWDRNGSRRLKILWNGVNYWGNGSIRWNIGRLMLNLDKLTAKKKGNSWPLRRWHRAAAGKSHRFRPPTTSWRGSVHHWWTRLWQAQMDASVDVGTENFAPPKHQP